MQKDTVWIHINRLWILQIHLRLDCSAILIFRIRISE